MQPELGPRWVPSHYWLEDIAKPDIGLAGNTLARHLWEHIVLGGAAPPLPVGPAPLAVLLPLVGPSLRLVVPMLPFPIMDSLPHRPVVVGPTLPVAPLLPAVVELLPTPT